MWQPIETAPKDKLWLLLRGGDNEVVVVGFWGESNSDSTKKYCWRTCWNHEDIESCGVTLTDWMALPTAPTTT